MNFLVTFFLIFQIGFSQNYLDYSLSFSKTEKESANTALNIDYLTNEEKNIFFYLNLVRENPKLFLETFLSSENQNIHYDKCRFSRNKKKCSYLNSLIDKLSNMNSLHPIIPNKDFYYYASCHAKKSGKIGYIGHSRIKTGCSSLPSPYGECCHYGSDLALDIIIDLLIDCGVSNLGHRKILLSNNFSKMGASIAPHKTYFYNTVLDLTD
tara:strand:- start:2 stop:631 length:630 start_codon:yes stop_codon:yes gene_type:complete